MLVAIGTNDFGTDVELGTLSDTEEGSFYSTLNVLCRGLKAKYYKAGIVFITPVKRRNENQNKLGKSIDDYRKAIREVAHTATDFKVINGQNVEIELENEEFMNARLLDGVHLDHEAGEHSTSDKGWMTLDRSTAGYWSALGY